MLVLFIVLIVGPIVAGTYAGGVIKHLPQGLAQPTGLNNNDTSSVVTGISAIGATKATATTIKATVTPTHAKMLLRHF